MKRSQRDERRDRWREIAREMEAETCGRRWRDREWGERWRDTEIQGERGEDRKGSRDAWGEGWSSKANW